MHKRKNNCPVFLFTLLFSFLLTACQTGTPEVPFSSTEQNTDHKKTENSTVFHSEDCIPENTGTSRSFPIMETETGYYFNDIDGPVLRLSYHDKATGKAILLCNKPECRHDGNEFCVATCSSYTPLGMQLYNNRIYVAAFTEKDALLEYKLLEVAPDGSQLTEISTLYSCPSPEFSPITFPELNYLLIHRNKAIFQFSLCLNQNFESNLLYGTAILNLENGELSYVYDNPVDKGNPQWLNPKPQEDSVFYVTKEPHRYRLHRYSLTDGTDEILDLVTNFNGEYVLWGNSKILYFRALRTSLWEHDLTDHTNTELDILYTPQYFQVDPPENAESMTAEEISAYEADNHLTYLNPGWYETRTIPYTPLVMHADDHYLYLMDTFHIHSRETDSVLDPDICGHFHVYDSSFQEVARIPLPTWSCLTHQKPSEGSFMDSDLSFRFLGDSICIYPTFQSSAVLKIKREDFLSSQFNDALFIHGGTGSTE